MLHMSAKRVVHPYSPPKRSDGHTCSMLLVSLNSPLASLLSFWHLATTAHVTVTTESVPPLVAKGDDVLVLVHNPPENVQIFAWFKGLTNMKDAIALYGVFNNVSGPGPAHSGRETIYRNGSLLIENLTKKDTGFYTLRTYDEHIKVITTTSTYLHVQDFLWNCGRHATSAQPTVESVPPSVAEGGSVTLLIHNLPENLQGFVWFKGISVFWEHEIARYTIGRSSSDTGPAHSGRETLNSDGSLTIHNVTRNDTGLYTLRLMSTDMKSEEAHAQLQVDKYVERPFVRVTNSVVSSHRCVIFTCVSPDTDVSIRWFFNNQHLRLSRRMTLSPTKCGLRICPVRLENFGEYQCEVSNRVSSKTSLPVLFE
ncbi:carcinoembryonic antigen-related cell adhesion molecule 3 [Phodopus roborovskii]|uniref:carcinoembryonic antigen-related cell adhesion molecule 3 n=1 Tax=Phodopus roborovskii TaxID=109678 RepID=UPI0021E3DDC4|nr:carcinoembryonic antigen-related cell adhesion molecule 3 [Phodopus roborovskii]